MGSGGKGRSAVLNETEKYAVYRDFTKKEKIHIRLIAEELLGMVETLSGSFTAYFWIDDNNKAYRLHLSAKTLMSAEKKEELLNTSTTGRNEAAKGVMNKLRDIYQNFWLNYNSVLGESGDPYLSEYMSRGGCTMGTSESTAWTLVSYKENLEYSKDKSEEWDELEKSIIANLADDISVGINGNNVEMVVTRSFQ